MSRPFFTFNCFLAILITCFSFTAVHVSEGSEKTPIIITSETLTADNKNNTATFEGAVVAKTEDITIYSDMMIVFYNNSENNVKRINATGNVKVLSKERAIFSQQASYIKDEEKIVFTGNPKAVEGNNVISGSQIIYFLKDDRTVVEGSKVILQNKPGSK